MIPKPMPIWYKDLPGLKVHQDLEDHLVKEAEEEKEARVAKLP